MNENHMNEYKYRVVWNNGKRQWDKYYNDKYQAENDIEKLKMDGYNIVFFDLIPAREVCEVDEEDNALANMLLYGMT